MSDPVDQRHEAKFNLFAALSASVWLFFLAPAVKEGWDERGQLAGWVGLLSVAVFSAVYVWSFVWARPYRRSGEMWRRVLFRPFAVVVLLLALGVVMVLTVRSAGLVAAVYVSVAAVTLLPWWASVPIGVVLATLGEVLARRVDGWQGADGISVSVVLAVFAVWGVWTAMRRSRDLVQAKEENAKLMIGQERARMARDLHDILGHSLTVIAVKAELADRLVGVSPQRARAEISDIQRLSRDALRDVRLTVDGVRDLSLPGEISRARAALQAAEIEAELPGSTDEVPSQVRELFAWTLREGVTNVVRHSRATHCSVTLAPDSITIADDGAGMPDARVCAIRDGHGLSGLRERAAAAGAHVVVDSPAGGGFSLTLATSAERAAASPGATGAVGAPRQRVAPARGVDARAVEAGRPTPGPASRPEHVR